MTELRRPRNGTGKHINHILASITADGLLWLPDPKDPFGWVAQCPFCRRTKPERGYTLKLRIDNDEWLLDEEYIATGTLTIGCANRCVQPNELRVYLMRNPQRIAYEREIETWKARYRWAVGALSRATSNS